MKLAEVLEMLAVFGIQEEEARLLLTQDDGWKVLQKRVENIWDALGDHIYDGAYTNLSRIHDKIQSLQLKSKTKSVEQQQREAREVADKFKKQSKTNTPLDGLKDAFNMFGGLFGTKL